jgi:7,8-dihydro-6-hydroxymethylpterin dimethyltransferase
MGKPSGARGGPARFARCYVAPVTPLAPAPTDPGAVVLKTTRTVCPTCLRPLDGAHFAHDGKVWLTRDCPDHGTVTALVASDRRDFYLRGDVAHPPATQHPSCIALLEITDACNLSCEACYAQSPSGSHVPFDECVRRLLAFVAQRGPLDVLQISGGEPTIHPDFLRILDVAKKAPITHVMINTNGLELARKPDLAAAIAARAPRVEVYLQMDGLDPQTHQALRGRDLVEIKRAALTALAAHGIPTTLVCTVVEGVNDREIADVLRLGAGLPNVRGVSFQPATYAGRYDLGADPFRRATLTEVLEALDEGTGGAMNRADFRPLPCSHPNCCSFTFAARTGGDLVPIPRLVDVDPHLAKLADRIAFTLDDAAACCAVDGTAARAAGLDAKDPRAFFRVVVKPFMDAYTYDQERIDECCVHVIDRDGRGVSFCEHNVLRRGRSDDGPLLRIGRGSDR